MSLNITSLNSGSNGNCYYVGNATDAVLIDAGISCREIEKRMTRLQLSLECVRAVFISHEHTDHIRGVEVLAEKHQIPVYINKSTLIHSRLNINNQLINDFYESDYIAFNDLKIFPFTKLHDAADPYSFIIESYGIKVGVFTDIGKACKRIVHFFQQCHACFLESNYDEQMLSEGNYPLQLKNRIRNGYGHLSNKQAFELFINHRPQFMSHLILSHLSQNNNKPELVKRLFRGNSQNVEIIVASRNNETPVYKIAPIAGLGAVKQLKVQLKARQLDLFGA